MISWYHSVYSFSPLQLPEQRPHPSVLSLWTVPLANFFADYISMHQHPHSLTMAQNLSSSKKTFCRGAKRRGWTKKKPHPWAAPHQWLKDTFKVPEKLVQGAKKITSNLQCRLELPQSFSSTIASGVTTHQEADTEFFVPISTATLGDPRMEAGRAEAETATPRLTRGGKRQEMNPPPFGDEEALKRVPVYNSINQTLALSGWFQWAELFQE